MQIIKVIAAIDKTILVEEGNKLFVKEKIYRTSVSVKKYARSRIVLGLSCWTV